MDFWGLGFPKVKAPFWESQQHMFLYIPANFLGLPVHGNCHVGLGLVVEDC